MVDHQNFIYTLRNQTTGMFDWFVVVNKTTLGPFRTRSIAETMLSIAIWLLEQRNPIEIWVIENKKGDSNETE